MRSHQMAYWKAVESYVRSPWYCPPKGHPHGPYAEEGRSPQSFWGHYWASQSSRCRYAHSPWPEPHRPDSTRRVRAWAVEEKEEEEEEEEGEKEEEEDTDSDEGVECDVSNMEITEELRQYFAETERHREERRKCMLPLLALHSALVSSLGYVNLLSYASTKHRYYSIANPNLGRALLMLHLNDISFQSCFDTGLLHFFFFFFFF